MSTDRKIKGHAGSYGVAKYGLLVFRIPGAAGGPANWFGWLGGWCRRAGCRPAKTAAIRLSSHWLKNAKAFYGFLVRWKGFLRLRSRYETVHRTVSPKFVARDARQIWSLLSGARIPTTQKNIIKSRKTQKRSTAFWYAGRDSNPRPSGS